MTPLRSPSSGRTLEADTPHSLSDGAGERWPIVDGIAFLRTGRSELVRDVLAHLDAGESASALSRLLVDQDDWWDGPPPAPDGVARLVANREKFGFREAMDLLGFVRVGDYLAHRWSDPTYLAGLALMEAHWNAPARIFELACGTGAYLRDLSRRGVSCSGGDVVFAKLWLARHWIVGSHVELICFDAASPWPIAGRKHDMVLCHDAFYFLEPKADVATRLREAMTPGGQLALAHVHNADHANFSSGAAMTTRSLMKLFPDALSYDDNELTRALVEARPPVPQDVNELHDVEAFSLMIGDVATPRSLSAGLTLPPDDAILRKNPLYVEDSTIRWPSDRYREEYAARATYPLRSLAFNETSARTREFVDLPERW